MSVQRLTIRCDEIQAAVDRLVARHSELEGQIAALAGPDLAPIEARLTAIEHSPALMAPTPPLKDIPRPPQILRVYGIPTNEKFFDHDMAELASELSPDELEEAEPNAELEGAETPPERRRTRGA